MSSLFDTNNLLKRTGLFWQYPVITEKEFYNQNKEDPNYCGVPWATCIDKRVNTNILIKIIYQYVHYKQYYTCCQHINFRKLIPLMKIIGIKTVYTPHKIKGEDIIHGVTIKPCPLYAVNIEDTQRNSLFKGIDFESIERPYLYSFVGGYQPSNYLTNIREKIFEMDKHHSAVIINTGSWHFNNHVYSSKQNSIGTLNENDETKKKTNNYNDILLKSRYSLCPSGSGPNSIRFWESLAIGSIPVLLADTLELPENIEWENAIIRLKEKELDKVNNILENIDEKREKEMRSKCIKIYNQLKNNYRNLFKNEIIEGRPTIFTSYMCDIKDDIIQKILKKWRLLNKDINILYFSDKDVERFFKETEYYEIYSQMKNGVAIADFFRINYINKYGGYWFDIDIEPLRITFPSNGKVHLFDCGFKNISYMFIGGFPNQKIFEETIEKVSKNIKDNIVNKKQHILDITGPRIIQQIVCNKLNIQNKDGCLVGTSTPVTYLKNSDYEFVYTSLPLLKTKTDDYKLLQTKYKKKQYQHYNYI
jgi:mannosyltransferase OCH1-like enzyme